MGTRASIGGARFQKPLIRKEAKDAQKGYPCVQPDMIIYTNRIPPIQQGRREPGATTGSKGPIGYTTWVAWKGLPKRIVQRVAHVNQMKPKPPKGVIIETRLIN